MNRMVRLRNVALAAVLFQCPRLTLGAVATEPARRRGARSLCATSAPSSPLASSSQVSTACVLASLIFSTRVRASNNTPGESWCSKSRQQMMSRRIRTRTRILVLPALIVCVLVLQLPAVNAGPASASPLDRPNPTWAGFGVTSSKSDVFGAFGSWIVPPVDCTERASSYSLMWIGIGGVTPAQGGKESLLQVGSGSQCIGGHPQYLTFQEMDNNNGRLTVLGCKAQTVCSSAKPVEAGDTIEADVAPYGLDHLRWSISDTRSGTQQWLQTAFWRTSSSHHSAECIVEDPPGQHVPLPFALKGTAQFISCNAIAHIANMPLSLTGPRLLPDWTVHTYSMVSHGRTVASASFPALTVLMGDAGHPLQSAPPGLTVRGSTSTTVPTLSLSAGFGASTLCSLTLQSMVSSALLSILPPSAANTTTVTCNIGVNSSHGFAVIYNVVDNNTGSPIYSFIVGLQNSGSTGGNAPLIRDAESDSRFSMIAATNGFPTFWGASNHVLYVYIGSHWNFEISDNAVSIQPGTYNLAASSEQGPFTEIARRVISMAF